MGPPLARREHELRAGFNGGPGTSHGVRNSMRDPMLQYGIQAGSSDLVGMWALNEGCNAGQSTGDEQAVKKRMDILADMEYEHKGPDGGNITISAVVTAVNDTAKKMEILLQALNTAKSHLSVKGKE